MLLPGKDPGSDRSRRLRRLAGVAAFVAVFAAAGSAQGASFVFTPTADAFTEATKPSTNFGSSVSLLVDASPVKRSYLRFDVRGLDAPVSSAQLEMDPTDSVTQPVDLRTVGSNTWAERTITHDNAPAAGSVVASQPGGVTVDPVRLNVTSLVAGEGPVSVALTSPSATVRKFGSRELSASAPRLVVETTSPDWPLVAAAGDTACDPASTLFRAGAGTTTACAQMRTSDLLRGRPLDAVLPLGDLQYPGGELAKFNHSYGPSWGRFDSLARPVPGNHEYETAGAAGYFDYFNGVGVANGPAGTRGKGYYSYDLGNWHLIALNSNCDDIPGGCGEGSPQNDWLEADLAAHPNSCTLAYFHHPRFTSGQHADDSHLAAPFWPDLYGAGVEVVLNGHDHLYERFGRQNPAGQADPAAGIRQFTVGTGGKTHYGTTSIAPNSAVRDSTSFGVLELRLGPDRYWWRFVPESRSSFTDTGTDVCAGATADSQPPTTPTNLTATPSGSGRVDLSWTASSDENGVARYRVLRDGTEIATPQTAQFVDTTVTAGQTYSYRVVAVDGAGNQSAPSEAATVTLPTGSVLRFRPADDATILQASPSSNYGARTNLQVDTAPVEQFLLRFEVSGIGSHAVRHVALELDPTNAAPSGGSVRSSSATWQEETVTWATAPAASGTALATIGDAVIGTRERVDLGTAVTGDGIYSFRVVGTSSDGADYASDESTTGAPPELLIEID